MGTKHKVVFSRFADDDINEIIDYYLIHDAGYAKKLLDAFEKKALGLYEYPKRGRIVPELEKQNILDYRELIEGNYRMIYSIEDKNVMIHAIIDARRNIEDILMTKLLKYYT
jgi:toxin ParE1/3/4